MLAGAMVTLIHVLLSSSFCDSFISHIYMGDLSAPFLADKSPALVVTEGQGHRQMGNGPRQAVPSSRSTSGHQSSNNLPWTPPWDRELSRGHRCCVPTALHCSSCRAGGFSDHVFNQNASKYDFIFIGKDSFFSLN